MNWLNMNQFIIVLVEVFKSGSKSTKDWVMKFLMELNESYKGIKAPILLTKPFLVRMKRVL